MKSIQISKFNINKDKKIKYKNDDHFLGVVDGVKSIFK